jgi:D-alanine-D-alanine ligase
MRVMVLFDLARPAEDGETFSPETLREREVKPMEADVLQSLCNLGHAVETLAVFDDVVPIIEKVKSFEPDVIFNMTESFRDNRKHEPNIPALLDLLQVPYTGSGPDGLILCKDKLLAKKVLAYHGVRTPHSVLCLRSNPRRKLENCIFPAFVKPVGQESSDGICRASFARNEAEALERARFIHERLGSHALIEEYIDGRELYVSVLGNRRLTVFPPREIFFDRMPEGAPRFATFNAKWNDAYRQRWGIRNGPPDPFDAGVEQQLYTMARIIYRALKIRGLARMDFRVKRDGELVFLEANPNPSLAEEDDFAQSALSAGIGYEALVGRVLQVAVA